MKEEQEKYHGFYTEKEKNSYCRLHILWNYVFMHPAFQRDIWGQPSAGGNGCSGKKSHRAYGGSGGKYHCGQRACGRCGERTESKSNLC